MSLIEYGFASFFRQAFEPYAARGLAAGRVVLTHRGRYRLHTDRGEVDGVLPGRLRHRAERAAMLPAIGDWVALDQPADGGPARIEAVLPRRGTLSRKVAGRRTEEQVVAANVDLVFLVMGLDGDFNLRRIERLLAMAWESGATPVVVLNKADAAPRPEDQRSAVEAVAPGADVELLSALDGAGVEALDRHLEAGRTIALVGSSGVGKSTLINRLAGHRLLATGTVRAGDDRGRHTTTHRQLVRLPSGALLIDNPGIRELQLWAADDGLDAAFDDLERLAADCRFRDCRHRDEPGCAVRAAVDDGRLPAARLANHHALHKELRHLALREDAAARRRENRRIAVLHKAVKAFKPRR